MRLIIAEKPSVARGIADVIGHDSRKDGCIECGDITITWCAGHLLEQVNPEDYVNGGIVRRDDLPVVPGQWQLRPKDDRASKQVSIIRALLKNAGEVVNAGDADREGQLLVDELLIYLGWKGKTLRLWLSSLDEESVKRALASLKSNDVMRSLYDSALARQRADWLLGLNGSIALSRNLKSLGLEGGWSVGRVQTPTLALIVDRHAQIKGHVKQDHYKVRITLKDGTAAWWQVPEDLLTDGLLLDKQQAEKIAQAVDGKTGKVALYIKRKGTHAAPLPFSLAALQMDANSRLGLSAKQTLEIAQALYEVKAITYPRTDCRYLPEEMRGNAAGILKSITQKNTISEIDPNRKHAAWNSAEVTAHHAIIPTGQPVSGKIDNKTEKVYELIRDSYIQLFMLDEEYEQQQAIFQFSESGNENLTFKATAKKVLKPGWTALGQEVKGEADNEQSGKALPDYTEGQQVGCQQATVQAQQTKPPKPYNDKTLIAVMTGIHKLVVDAKLKVRLKETSGLGTEATRAAIIETLFIRGYAERKGKDINPTERGIKLITMIRKTYPALADPGETAIQEDALADIASKKLEFDNFINSAISKTKEEVSALLGNSLAQGEIAMLECPSCGKESCVKLTSKAGNPYWKCRECQTAFGNDNGKPGQAFEKREGDERRSKPESGPACPYCKGKTEKYLTKTGKTYYRCGKCKKAYWPDFKDKNKIGKEWEIKK